MSAIRAFLGKLPRPSCRQAVVGGTAVSAALGGAWYLQQNGTGQIEAVVKRAQEAVMKKEAPPAAVEVAIKKEEDAKPQQAGGEEAAGK